MNPIIGGALISGAASLLGGSKSSSSAAKINRQNIRLQREFAQHGIRWRVEDAQKAGVHPLYAIGANVPTYSPSSVVDPMGDAISQAGQAIGRGVAATAQPESGVPPSGPVVYPIGSTWPHYTGKDGKAVPYSASQAASMMALENHRKQLEVMDAQIQASKPQPNSISQMFEMFQHPSMGLIPFPNQVLGEVAEALADPIFRGMWMAQVKATNPTLYSRMAEEAVQGRATTITELLGAIPGIVKDTIPLIVEELKNADWGLF